MAGANETAIRLKLFAPNVQHPEENVWLIMRDVGDKKIVLGECKLPLQIQQAFQDLIEGKQTR